MSRIIQYKSSALPTLLQLITIFIPSPILSIATIAKVTIDILLAPIYLHTNMASKDSITWLEKLEQQRSSPDK